MVKIEIYDDFRNPFIIQEVNVYCRFKMKQKLGKLQYRLKNKITKHIFIKILNKMKFLKKIKFD